MVRLVADFLLEIGTEEMPALAVKNAVEELERIVREDFQTNRLIFEDVKVFATPRRLAVLVNGLKERQEDTVNEVKGPPASELFDLNGDFSLAARAFAERQGVGVESLIEKETPRGKYLFAVKRKEGRSTVEVLKEILPSLIKKVSFQKSMRWQGKLRFIRPIRWLVALFDGEVVDFELDGLKAANLTRGHRFLSRGEIRIDTPGDYVELLRRERVVVDQGERKAIIQEGLRKEAGMGKALVRSELMDEVVYLVENPWVIRCSFPEEYLKLPGEVVVEVLESHQRYFPWVDDGGNLLPGFFCVSNGSVEVREVIKEGNERVVKARLEDAKFYYQEDLKKPLSLRVEELKGMIFQEKLGTLWDKTYRNERLAEFLAEKLSSNRNEFDLLKRAARLAKTDLVTEMVKEFPELQGIMGREYALKDGEPWEVAQAIYEHYLPRYSGDDLPETRMGQILGVVDKVDTVSGYFLAGLLPTGSEDPYSLRRQAQGAVTIIFQKGLDFSLSELIKKTLFLYSEQLNLKVGGSVFKSLEEFFLGRIERFWRNQGYSHFSTRSLLSRSLEKPVFTNQLIGEIEKAQKENWWVDVLIAYYRAKNLSSPDLGTEVDPSLFVEEEERLLYNEAKKSGQLLEELREKAEWKDALKLLAKLRPPIDLFFDSVLVMAEDERLRKNRLKLLNLVVCLFERVADFSVFPKIF